MAFEEAYSGIETIGTTEHDLPSDTTSLGSLTDDGVYMLRLDTSALADADSFLVRAYEKVRSSSTQRLCASWTVGRVQGEPFWESRQLILIHGWTFSVTKLAGTDRSIEWSIMRSPLTITEYAGTETVGTTEHDLTSDSSSLASRTDKVVAQTWIEQNNVTAADLFLLKAYDKVRSGGTQRLARQIPILGGGAPIYVSPTIGMMNGWAWSLDKISGTDRAIDWSVRTAG